MTQYPSTFKKVEGTILVIYYKNGGEYSLFRKERITMNEMT